VATGLRCTSGQTVVEKDNSKAALSARGVTLLSDEQTQPEE
jgi:hypothetical protein